MSPDHDDLIDMTPARPPAGSAPLAYARTPPGPTFGDRHPTLWRLLRSATFLLLLTGPLCATLAVATVWFPNLEVELHGHPVRNDIDRLGAIAFSFAAFALGLLLHLRRHRWAPTGHPRRRTF